MIVDTKAYGKVAVEEKQIFHFNEGILGFESIKDYVLIDSSQYPFMWLQALEVEHVAFIVIDPMIFRPDYDPGLTVSQLNMVNLKDAETALLLAIVTIPDNQKDMTANLQGPILLNREKRVGKQFISADNRWLTKHNILEELSQKREHSC